MGFQPRVALACEAVRRAGLPDGFDPLKVRSSFDAVQDLVLWGSTGGGGSQRRAATDGGRRAAAGGRRRDVEVERVSGVWGQGASIGESVDHPSLSSWQSPLITVTTVLTTPCLLDAGSVLLASMFASLPTGRLGGLMAHGSTVIRTV